MRQAHTEVVNWSTGHSRSAYYPVIFESAIDRSIRLEHSLRVTVKHWARFVLDYELFSSACFFKCFSRIDLMSSTLGFADFRPGSTSIR